MASVVEENWDYVDGQDESEDLELSQINHNLLMSLLDETPIEDCDDERLRKVIRSLEAEIDDSDDNCYSFDHHSTMWESEVVDCQSSNDELNGQDRSVPQDDLDLRWMDMETMPTSPLCYVNTTIEDQDYGSLWHDTNVNMNDSFRDYYYYY
ncbi:hypothetical protein ABFS83_13G054700 [Erythranthe nasuta]